MTENAPGTKLDLGKMSPAQRAFINKMEGNVKPAVHIVDLNLGARHYKGGTEADLGDEASKSEAHDILGEPKSIGRIKRD